MAENEPIFPSDRKNKSVLIIHISGRVGDSLLGTPAINAIENFFLDSKIDLLAHKNRAQLFQNFPNINILKSLSGKAIYFRGWLKIKKYDYIFILNLNEKMLNFVAYALRVGKKVIAFDTANFDLNKKLFHCQKIPSQKLHMVDKFLKITDFLSFSSNDKRIKFFPTKYELVEAENLLRKISGGKNLFFVGFQTNSFSTRSFRDWPLLNFSKLAKLIKNKNRNAHFLLFGSKDDTENTKKLRERIGLNDCSDFSGLSLRFTASIMSKINLYVGVDTGPSIMMSAFDVPMICLYHPKFASYLAKPLGHKFSYAIDCKAIPSIEKANMASIKPNEVFFKLKGFL